MQQVQIKPHFKVVAINETSDWRDDFIVKCGRLYGLYLFDVNRHVHCCELTPSYELHFIETVAEKEIDDYTDALLREANAQCQRDVEYYHCNVIDRMHESSFVHVYPSDKVEYESYEALLQDMLEFVHCNQQCPSLN